MISNFQAVILGILQGISELFPVSSLGHSVILPKLLGWNIHSQDSFFLTFLVGTHLATAVVLFFYFFADWKKIIQGVFVSLFKKEVEQNNYYGKLGWLLIAGTIPAGILGLLFEKQIRAHFVSSSSAAFFLILNGFVLLAAEALRRRSKERNNLKGSDERLSELSFSKALLVGSMQAIALIPGFSRTGASLAGGLLVGLSHEDSARFSFLLATPIIGAAALLKLPDLASDSGQSIVVPTLIGGVFAGIFAYFSIRFLTKYFERSNLIPFAIYCLLIGVLSSCIFLLS